MKIALLISGIIELLGGIVCYLHPELLFSQGNPMLYRMYGLSASVIGIITILLFRFYAENKLHRLSYITLMFFHGALAMIIYSSSPEFINYKLGGTLTHLLLFVIFLMGYLQDLKPDIK